MTAPEVQLTPRMVEILGLISHGVPTEEIAARMFVDVSIVKKDLGRAMQHFGARNRYHLMLLALRAGVIQ